MGKDDKYQNKPFASLCEILGKLLELRMPEKDNYQNSFWSFRGQRDSSWGLGRPKDKKQLEEFDRDFVQYKRRCKEFPQPNYLADNTEWRWLYHARHYNLNGRLMDWTSNPLVAIYFAVENIISKVKPDEDNTIGGAIWILKVDKINFRTTEAIKDKYKRNGDNPIELAKKLKPKEWFMINPEPITERIVRQSGKFTFHPGNEIEPLDNIKRRKGEELIKLTIDPKKNSLIRDQLGIMNIHHASLFPSPTGVAEFVNNEWPRIGYY